jgi:hypothetical protein
MCVVYLAEDMRLDRKVAIKIFRVGILLSPVSIYRALPRPVHRGVEQNVIDVKNSRELRDGAAALVDRSVELARFSTLAGRPHGARREKASGY